MRSKRIGLVSKTTGAEIVLVEVGGTVGDIESLPFLESLRQMRSDVGRQNSLYIHVTWLPHIGATGELKLSPPSTRCGNCAQSGFPRI